VIDDERLARVALGKLTEPGDARVAQLVAELGAVRLHDLLRGEHEADGLATEVASRLAGLDPAGDLHRAATIGIRYVIPGDDEWPAQLDDLMRAEVLDERGGPPLGLWVKGPRGLDELDNAVAVVGARSATTYGAEVAAAIGGGLARAGHPVVSGAAYGIDHAAHRGTLAAGGSTVAVLAAASTVPTPSPTRSCSTISGAPRPSSPRCRSVVRRPGAASSAATVSSRR
jgi:DNA processing protein